MYQQDYIPLSSDLPAQTIIHHQPTTSVKSEDEISEILDLSMQSSQDNQLQLMLQGRNRAYEQLFHSIESTFNGIREELKHRNQIESQRIAVEIAKFKYLHPYFTYDM